MRREATRTGRRIVVGMGLTGLSCARFLARRGETFAVADSRVDPLGIERFRAEFPGVELRTGELDAGFLASASELVVSPGLDPRQPALAAARAAGTVVLGDIELFHRAARAPIVAITGTNGKSTVTTLVGAMANAAGIRCGCGGNLGTPALDLLDPAVALYVLELSSFQLETVIDFAADVATVLNFAADHLDRYPDLESYHRAKLRIYAGARHVVVNRDDPRTMPAVDCTATRGSFGAGPAADGGYGLVTVGGGQWLAHGEQPLLAVAELGLRGGHNVCNALAALALADAAGIPRAAQLAVLRGYRGLPHRCQHVRRLDGVDWYDDSKGTNVAAAVAALRGLAADCRGRIVLLAGGVAKENDFSALAAELRRVGRAAVLIGEAAGRLQSELDGAVELHRAAGMDEAVAVARALARPDDIVLLSPACASFDMFRNFEERGAAFARAVQALATGGAD
ncbi:MAG: UDP-N-acetylmuramoylalanine--D-glutamate ligase [Pseudomonadales bacterium]|nr:UDP-N-acetylmuramoylalanine--D-glutamate ligase [Pseudomonadales bacterium]